jgi:hypothetical protein
MSWYIKLLIKEQKIYPKKIYEKDYKFAFEGTVNWMRALSLIIEEKSNLLDRYMTYLDKKIKKYYKHDDDFSIIFNNILMSFHYLNSIKTINNFLEKKTVSSVTRTQIINWYYAVYYSAKAMNWAENKLYSEQHSGVAKDWHELVKRNLIMEPFNLYLPTLVEKDYEKEIKKYKRVFKVPEISRPLKYPKNTDYAYSAIISYLRGTAKFYKKKKEDELKDKHKINNFRSKKNKEIRDKYLDKYYVNFLHEAFRYRGKANYRDSIFLIYKKEDKKEEILYRFMKDLENVGETFIKMSLIFINKKCNTKKNRKYFINFYNDLKQHLLFDCDLIEMLFRK